MQFLLTKQRNNIAPMDTIEDGMGSRFKQAREQMGITQQDLADYVGVSRAAVAQWENGDTNNIRPENLFRAAHKLNKSAKWLALGELPEEPPELVYEAIQSLPGQSGQQSLDFIKFQWNNAEGLVASEKIARYSAMIESIKKDMESRKKQG